MFKGSINTYLYEYLSKDYAGQEPPGEILLDCSLGVNSDPLADSVFDTLHSYHQRIEAIVSKGNYADIKYYPHDESLKDSLADWFIRNGVGEGWMTRDNFILGNGSYDILVSLNMLCLTRGRIVLGHAPQFTAYIDSVYCTGSDYRAVRLPKADNYRFDADSYLEMMTEDISLFIIENPNNPTGQSIPLESLARVADKAMSMDKILVVDEAYAEYLPAGESAVNLIPNHPNVIVTRSFSKGWGMAGLRLGYAVTSAETGLTGQLAKIVLPFNSNALARSVAKAALEQDAKDPFGIETVRSQKKRLIDGIAQMNAKYGKDLRIAETHEMTPIMMIYCGGCDESSGRDFDLCAHMMTKGLLTVGCGSYPGLNAGAVRLMLPESTQMDLLMELMEQVIRDLPQEFATNNQ